MLKASCCNEAFKIATTCNPYLSNYMMYSGNDSIYTYTFEHQKKDDCPVCGNLASSFTANSNWTLADFIENLAERQEMYVRISLMLSVHLSLCSIIIHYRQIKKPSLRTALQSLYLQAPPQLEEATRPNLQRPLKDMVANGQEVSVTDPGLPFSIKLRIQY